MRSAIVSLITATSFTLSATAGAVEKAACIDAHAQIQKLRRAGHLAAARQELVVCLDPGCPGPVRAECGEFAVALDAAQPTLLVDLDDASSVSAVLVDGNAIDVATLARPLELDPGEHRVDLTTTAGSTSHHRVLLREGERGKVLRVTLAERPAPASVLLATLAPPRRRVPTASWVLLGTGSVGIAASAVFGTLALTKGAHLQERCGATRSCPEDEVHAVERNALVADLSFVVSLVSLAAGLTVWQLSKPQASRAEGR
jgi:hypothetical protein